MKRFTRRGRKGGENKKRDGERERQENREGIRNKERVKMIADEKSLRETSLGTKT